MLRLREYELVEAALSVQQAVELAALAKGYGRRVIENLLPTSRPGVYLVRAGSYVGRFAVGDGLVVDIASRFPFVDLVEILRVASRSPALLDDGAVPQGSGRGIIDVLAAALARETARVIGRGIAKGYASHTFTAPPYPGTLDVTAHMARHAGRPDRLVTQASRLTVDIPENQILAAAVDRLRRQSISDVGVVTRLRQVAAGLSGISRVRDPLAAWPRRRVAPRGYTTALALGRLVLNAEALVPVWETYRGAGVLFEMSKVWEAFVTARVEPQLPAAHRLIAQYPIGLTDSGPVMTAKADLVQLDPSGSPVHVIDAKYVPYSARPSADHIYQVLTYAHRLGVRRATLVHPGRGERAELVVGSVRVVTIGLPTAPDAGMDVLER